MTLIFTQVTSLGMVHAADSNLTVHNTTTGNLSTIQGSKIFQTSSIPAAIAVAGSYTVAGERFDSWMPKCIADFEGQTSLSGIGGLAKFVVDRLQAEMHDKEKAQGTTLHIGGFTRDPDGAWPEFYRANTWTSIDQSTGAYTFSGTPTFTLSEDMSKAKTRDLIDTVLQQPHYWVEYFNGLPDGRIAFDGLRNSLNKLLEGVWSNSSWRFRPPKSISEAGEFVKRRIEFIGTLFEVSDYPVAYIGGDVRVVTIPWPV